MKDLIHKAQIHELKEAMEKSTNMGMQTFDQALYELYKAGKIDFDEAIKNADSANNLRLRVKLNEEGGAGFEDKSQARVGVAPAERDTPPSPKVDSGDLKLNLDH